MNRENIISGVTIAGIWILIIVGSTLFWNAIGDVTHESMAIVQSIGQSMVEINEEKQNELEACVNNGYVVYLDGSMVQADTIDFSLYKTSISHENKAIYMTGID